MSVTTLDLSALGSDFLAAEQRCELHSITIEECDERLVAFPEDLSYPYYRRHMGVGMGSLYVRQTIANMLFTANELAREKGYTIVLYDGYRDNDLQEKLFLMYLAFYTAPRLGLGRYFSDTYTPGHVRLKLADLPRETAQMLVDSNMRFVALPSDDPVKVANHRTGGSVDVWLYQNGEPCDMGVAFDYMDEEAYAFYHLQTKHKPWPTKGDDKTVNLNRTVLLECMIGSGFTAYPYEIWHYDYGNQRHARIVGGPAIYGVADNLLPA